ncbi:hypothetical protein BD560DRAFT_408732 [Blakeslea trispora]|nr:hypothetical protein BD560DRAFT_408732 [Blakeslea trispora]
MADSLNRTSSFITYQLTRTLTPEPKSCRTCEQKGIDIDFQQCLETDLSPKVYLKLATILSGHDSNVETDDNQDEVAELNTYAALIAEDTAFASLTIEKLYLLCLENERLRTIQTISQLLGEHHQLHKYRELKFIQLLCQEIKSSTIQQVKKQVEAKVFDLNKLIVSDIKLSRLIPLLGIIYGCPDNLLEMTLFRQDSLSMIHDTLDQQLESVEETQLYEEENAAAAPTSAPDILSLDIEDSEHLVLSLALESPNDSSTSKSGSDSPQHRAD